MTAREDAAVQQGLASQEYVHKATIGPRVYVLHQLDGSAIYGVFSDKAKAALWNYESGFHAHITEYVLDNPLKEKKEPKDFGRYKTHCAGCAGEFGPDLQLHWTKLVNGVAHNYCYICAKSMNK